MVWMLLLDDNLEDYLGIIVPQQVDSFGLD